MKLTIHDFFYAINGWRMNVYPSIISNGLDKHKSTISRLFNKIDDLVIWQRGQSEVNRIGGHGCIVEIDECMLVKRKYRRGRILRGQKWVIGGVVLGTLPSIC